MAAMKPITYTLEQFQEWGRSGGKKAASKMTKKQRHERAIKGAAARKARRGKK